MPLETPIAYVASHGDGTPRRRRDMRIAAVLSEFGYRARVGDWGPAFGVGPEMLDAVSQAAVVVCDLVRPDSDIPVEVALAATRQVPVVVLMPAGVEPEGCAAQLLHECGATIVRYDRAEPHQVLHARLAERENGARGLSGDRSSCPSSSPSPLRSRAPSARR